jgi:hypothetical protein
MIAIGVLFLLAVGFAIIWFFTLASLTVTTNDASNTIFIRQKSATTQQQVTVDQQGNTTTAQLAPGTYIVTVQNATQTASQVLTLSAAEHKAITINLQPQGSNSITNEPVSSMGARSVSVSKDLLRFIDNNTADRTLYSIDSSGTATKLDGSVMYTSVSWANPNFGIGYGLNHDNRYVFTKIEGNFVTPIKPPFSVTAASSTGVAPNQTWYVSDGKVVYRGNADGSFTEVFKSDNKLKIMTVSNDALLLSQQGPDGRGEGNLITLHQNGDKYQIEGEAYEAAWSPSGDKLVTSGDTSEIFDNKLNKIGTLPQGNFMSPAWLDDNTLVYGVSNSVIRYNLNTGASSTMMTFDDVVGRPSQIVPSVENDYLYTTIQKGGDRPTITYRLDRLPLKNQTPVDVPVGKFALLIPNTVSGCELNFMNFAGKFSIITKSSTNNNCAASAAQYFTDYGASTANLTYQQIKN